NVHPAYRSVVHTLTDSRGVELVEAAFDSKTGTVVLPEDAAAEEAGFTAVVIPQPGFFGVLEAVDPLTQWAHSQGALAIAVVDPVSQALLKTPNEWGGEGEGADICCGEGQSLGAPLAFGGPYFGFLATRRKLVRQLPGRIVGRTVDMDGKPGYTLTLQAREQHIRRARATSNICTNQGLLVTAATIHMALLGPEGLTRVAEASVANTRALVRRLCEIPDVETVFSSTPFNEAVLRLPRPVAPVLEALAQRGILGGADLQGSYPELGNALLVCATETRNTADIEHYGQVLAKVLTA
ncbi:MAG: glycine dehydrogenase, partial [Sinobacteraceae bacterium]|nr:glycine dehydrogenase [Nevskiaceae bacterium]